MSKLLDIIEESKYEKVCLLLPFPSSPKSVLFSQNLVLKKEIFDMLAEPSNISFSKCY